MEERADLGPWIDLAGQAVTPIEDAFPVARIAALLADTLHAEGVSFSWASGNLAGARTWSSIISQAEQEEFLRCGALRHDPLAVWFERTRRGAPQLYSRVPGSFGTAAFQEWAALLRRRGVRDRLSMPIHLTSDMHVAFVLAVDDHPFTEADLSIAARLQPLLAGLFHQAQIRRCHPGLPDSADIELTTRELSVLYLLTDGLTAAAIARRLGIAERTAQKHLENLYRKLGARDRLTAVLRAQLAGLLMPPGMTWAGRPGAIETALGRFLTRIAPAVSPLPVERRGGGIDSPRR